MPAKPSRREPRIAQRLRALEKSVEELRKIVGDLKYELEQMREE